MKVSAQDHPSFSIPVQILSGGLSNPCYDHVKFKIEPCYCHPNGAPCEVHTAYSTTLSRIPLSATNMYGTLSGTVETVPGDWKFNWACSWITICFGTSTNPECVCIPFQLIPPNGTIQDLGPINVGLPCCPNHVPMRLKIYPNGTISIEP